MFRLIRALFTLVILVVAGLLAYNYWKGHGWTLALPSAVDADTRGEVGGTVKSTADKRVRPRPTSRTRWPKAP